ncbi:MAG: hypothetical protein IJS14_02435 [Lentisphaeria bacterium]|nr:hypothetical protein [Lentisphaeria bacterium]
MKKGITISLIGMIVLIAAAYGIYLWCFCRFYVPAGYMAVVTAKSGTEPKPGQILVERGQRGIWKEVLTEGRHFLDPVMHDVAIVKAIRIPIGQVGIVTSKVGKPLPPGEIIAPDHSYQGVWRDVLGPGMHRLNPQGYSVEITDAVNIPIGYVGVVTSQTGKAAPAGQFAGPGSKGVLKDVLQPGLYYINPRAYQVNVIEIGMNQVSMTGKEGSVIEMKNSVGTANTALQQLSSNTLNRQLQQRMNMAPPARQQVATGNRAMQQAQNRYRPRNARRVAYSKAMPAKAKSEAVADMAADAAPAPARGRSSTPGYSISNFVEFPSRDGFKILMDMTVEFELLPENVSRIYMLYGDLPQVVEKIILPQILSVSRLKGSSYKAQDFIMGEGRETFQKNLRDELVRSLKEKRIIIHNAIIRNVAIPRNILQPIQESSLAKEQNLTNFSLQETAKIEAELNSQIGMIEQKRQEVEQETRKLVAEIKAGQEKSVRLIQAQTELEVARLQLKRSEIEARRKQLIGETDIKAEFVRRSETAKGVSMKAEALGKHGIMADLSLIEALNPNLKLQVIYAGEGTLWTDLKSGAIPLAPAPRKR